MTHFYQCESDHWCASDEKIAEFEWGLAYCSKCKFKIKKSPQGEMPPSHLWEFPVVKFANEIEDQDFAITGQKVTYQESDSQEELYLHLNNASFTFLSRDLNFRGYKKGGLDDEAATIPEPGVIATNAYTTRVVGFVRRGIGRLEIKYEDGYFQEGLVTYPDYFTLKNSVIYAIELKTPRTKDFKTYLSAAFWTDANFGKRSIVDEMKNRRRIMPNTVMQVLLFDIRNFTTPDTSTALIDLKNSVRSLSQRKEWFSTNINSVMFFDGTLSKLISMPEILAGQESRGTQKNIMSYFGQKPSSSSGDQPPTGY